jgi:uncharacterized membrane protein YczE
MGKRSYRLFYYLGGMIFLAVGLTLNTKTGLGTAPVLTIPLSISEIWDIHFASLVFILYAMMTCFSFLLSGKKRSWRVFLQIPFSMVFSLLLNFFGELLDLHPQKLPVQLLLLLIAMMITAVGVASMVNMNMIANPADGFAQTLGIVTKRGMGFGKNILDISCAIISMILCMVTVGHLVGVGIGTLISMIGVGRFIAVFQHFFKDSMQRRVGLIIDSDEVNP